MKRFGDFRLDSTNQCLWQKGAQIPLQPKPFAVLNYLVSNHGRLVTHDELLDALWPETYVQPQVLRTYVLELRKLLGDDARQPRFIQSLPKRGYQFIAPVIETEAAVESTASNGPSAVSILGRTDELKALASAFERARSGQRQFICLTGDSGMGKTALMDAFCRSLPSEVSLARGQCVQGLAQREEYYPVREALAQLHASPAREDASPAFARIAAGWLGARTGGPIVDRSNEAHFAPGNLCTALEEFAAEKPLILILEDVHWADSSTLGLLSALARRRARAQLLLLTTCNPQQPHAENSIRLLKQDLMLRKLCTEIVLSPLTRPIVAALLSQKLENSAAPEEIERFVYRRSEGNPLFATVILDHLLSEKFLVRAETDDGPRWVQRAPLTEIESSIPEELAQMIELEIEALDAGDQRLLEAASLFTVAFPAWGLAAALDAELASIEEACDALARRILFVRRAGHDELPDGSRSAFYVFAHGLYRDVLYQRQSPARRAQRHLRVAERLAELFVGREMHVAREVAIHHEAAGSWAQAVASLRAAAQFAHQRQAFSLAADLLQDALRIASNLSDAERSSSSSQIRIELDAANSAANPHEDNLSPAGKV